MPICPLIKNTQERSLKITKFFKNQLKNMKILTDIYNIKKSIGIADELNNLRINQITN